MMMMQVKRISTVVVNTFHYFMYFKNTAGNTMFVLLMTWMMLGPNILHIRPITHAAPVDKRVCENPSNPVSFSYECLPERDREVELCFPGRHLRVPEADCSSGDVDPHQICVPCEDGTYMDVHNYCDSCKEVKVCGPDEVETRPPTKTKDRECAPRPPQTGTSGPSSAIMTDEQRSTPTYSGGTSTSNSSNKTRENTNPKAETGIYLSSVAFGLMLLGIVCSFFLGCIVLFAILKKCNPCGNNAQNATNQGGNALPSHVNSRNGPTGQRPTSLTSGDGPPSGHRESPRNQEEMPMLDVAPNNNGQPPVTAEPDGSTN